MNIVKLEQKSLGFTFVFEGNRYLLQVAHVDLCVLLFGSDVVRGGVDCVLSDSLMFGNDLP